MKIYTREVKAHNAPVKSDPVLSGGQGDVGTDMQICDSLGVKLLTRLRFEFSHLNEHKCRHGFKDTLNLLCTCGAEVETTEYFLLHCQLYSTHRSELFDKIVKVHQQFSNLTVKDPVLVLLCGSQRNNSENSNQNIGQC